MKGVTMSYHFLTENEVQFFLDHSVQEGQPFYVIVVKQDGTQRKIECALEADSIKRNTIVPVKQLVKTGDVWKTNGVWKSFSTKRVISIGLL